MKRRPPYRPLVEDDYGRRRFMKDSVLASLGGAGLVGTLGAMFQSLQAAEERPLPKVLDGKGYRGGKQDGDDAVKTGTFFFPRLKFHVKDRRFDIWDVGPSGDAILRRKLRDLTNINASEEPVVVSLDDLDKMSRYPYVFMTAETEFDLTPKDADNLREYLLRGGFIHADDCCHSRCKGRTMKTDLKDGVFEYKVREKDPSIDGDRFFMDYVRIINSLFPDNPMRPIPPNHEIHRCYFHFDRCPVMQGVDHGLWGLFEKGTGRLMTVVSPGDLHCGWMNRYWAPEKNLEGIKMGINILMYYLTH
ncbi:MAG: DUF4159 domain-containing protein [Planctomycetota bacterium]|nr:DUF4159 domain-containing protein [Planctomycetota bacterium]